MKIRIRLIKCINKFLPKEKFGGLWIRAQVNFYFVKKINIGWKVSSVKINAAFIEGLSYSDENSLILKSLNHKNF